MNNITLQPHLVSSEAPAPVPNAAGASVLLRMGRLTKVERIVLDWLGTGRRNCEIAALLERSERTIENHLRAIFQKLGVRKRGEAIAVQRQWLAVGVPLPPPPKQGRRKV